MNKQTQFHEWKSWLRINAEKHFIEGNRRFAWKGVKGAHNPRSTLSKQLSLYYKNLPAEQQALFKKGLVECLLNMPHKTEYLVIFNEFIQLSVECDCDELVDSIFFEKIIFRGKLGFLNKKNQNREVSPCLYHSAITALRYFANKGTGGKIVSLGYKMARSPYFPQKHVYLLFLVLCKAQPHRLFNHWKMIRKIHFLFRQEIVSKNHEVSSPSAYPVLRSELSHILDVEYIKNFQSKIKGLSDYCPDDEWLIHLLHNQATGPLVLESISNQQAILIKYAQDPSELKCSYRQKSLSEGFIKVVAEKYADVVESYNNGAISAGDVILAYNLSTFNIQPSTEIEQHENRYCSPLLRKISGSMKDRANPKHLI